MSFNELLVKNLAIIIGVAILGFICLLIWIITLQVKLRTLGRLSQEFFQGSKVTNLEEILLKQANNLKILDKDIQELYAISNKINSLAQSGLYKFATVRFNPFKETGGNQSFSVALLNGKNNGLTITALHSREGTRVYAKSLINCESKSFPLTEEEKSAIELALTPQEKRIK